jgi:TetR/AcrR family transcriptional regulator, transcriptional repressor for nem operon
MRYSTEHKEETRERIVRTASRHLRRRGGKGVAIADLMSKLDLTHGGFYKHFDSKQELLVEAIAKAFEETELRFTEAVSKAKPGTELRTLIEHYLSLEHCSNAGEGCPMAALASEISRFPRSVRAEIDRAIKGRVKRVARFMPGATEKERERNCMALLSGLIGTVSVARAVVEPEVRKAVLDASKDFYIKSFCN